METIQVQLPKKLAQRLRQEIPEDKALDHALVEAVQLWLAEREKKSTDKERALHALRQAGLLMPSERQHAMAEAVLRTLPQRALPADRMQVRTNLAKLKTPLSEEILAMRVSVNGVLFRQQRRRQKIRA